MSKYPIAVLARWLKPSRIADPVDRRNAPMMQILLLLIGLLPPLAWAHRVIWPARPMLSAEWVAMAMSLTLSALAWACLVLIQRGHFRPAVRVFLTVALVNMVISFAASGMAAQHHSLAVNAVWLVMAGLMLGRRELWAGYGAVLLAFALALRTDLKRPGEHWSNVTIDATTAAVIFLFIVIVVDRTVAALRESLADLRQSDAELRRVNQRLRAEMVEREQAERRLVHAQKMKAIGQLAGGVAHDFNNVLSVVLGYAGRRTHMTDLASAEALLKGIEKAADRGAGIARRLLGLVRHDSSRPEVFDAADALRDAVPMLRQMFPDSVRVDADIGNGPALIRFDRSQFDLVLLNIAANARDALSGSGRFRVALRADPQQREVRIDLEDDGIGMDAAVRDRLFEPFFSTKAEGDGYGLGLSVVESLITEANGAIGIDSAPGAGTRVRLQLPLLESERNR